MKDANSRQRRKITTPRFLAMLLIISITASLVGCTPAFCTGDNADKTLLERLETFADQAVQAAQSVGDALDSAADAVIDAIKQPQTTTHPNDSEPPLQTGGGFGPYCPPFEEELDVYYTYEKLDKFLNQKGNDYFVDTYGLYVFTVNPIGYSHSVLAEEFKRIYGYEPNYFPDVEMVGQFYIDGEDWVAVYKLAAERHDYTLIMDNLTEGQYTYFNEDGSYIVGFQTFFGEWENTDVFDDNADCWKEYEEYKKTDEYKQRLQEMLDTMCQLSGMTVYEMDNDERFSMRIFSFASNVCDMEGNIFSVLCMYCRYDPVAPPEETSPTTEPSEPAAE